MIERGDAENEFVSHKPRVMSAYSM
jgi:hypothetical protein